MAYDMTGDSSGGDLPFPRDSYERDRLRIQREIERDLNHTSFTSSSLSGLENVGNTYLGDDDSIEINYDPRMRGRTNMLESSPDINSRILVTEFADFSMAANEFEDEIETGRGPRFPSRYDNKAAQSPARTYPLPRNSGSTKSKKFSDAYTSTRTASPVSRTNQHHTLSTVHSEPSEYVSINTKMQSPEKQNENQQPTATTTDEMSLHIALGKATHSTPKKPQTQRQPSVESSSGGKPRKTTEQNPEYQNRLRDEDALSVASADALTLRNPKQASDRLAFLKGSTLKSAMNKAHESKRRTSGGQAPVPKSFQSTEEFIRELGLDGHTATINLYNQLNKSTRDQDATSTQEASFLLPQIAGISELINAEATRLYQSSIGGNARKRGTRNVPPTHKPIESIPVPEDNRAVLTAMQLLQERVAGLEKQKQVYDRRVNDLKTQLKETKKMYDAEYARAKVAEAEVERRKRVDRHLGKVEEESDRKAADQERIKTTLLADNKQLRETVESQKEHIESVQHHLEITRTVLRNMHDERNTAVTTAATSLAAQEDLKRENADLRHRIEALKIERLDSEVKFNTEKEAWKVKEEKLRRRIDRARDADATTRKELENLKKKFGENKDTAPIDSTTEELVTETVESKPHEKAMSELVRRELEKMRPDLFPTTSSSTKNSKQKSKATSGIAKKHGTAVQQSNVTVTTSTTEGNVVKSSGLVNKKTGKRVTVKDINDVINLPANGPTTVEPQPNVEVDTGSETAYTVNGDYIRRIADEIDEERRRRKTAEKKATVAEAEMRRLALENGHIIASSKEKRRSTGSKATMSAKVNSENTTTTNGAVEPSSQLARPSSVPPANVNTPSLAAQKVYINMPRKRRIKKVVYYEEGDTTEIITDKPSTVARAQQQQATTAEPAAVNIPVQPSPEEETARRHSAKSTINTHSQATAESSTAAATNAKSARKPSVDTVDNTPLPKPPVLPEHIQQVLETDEEHDPKSCTVCLRKEQNTALDVDKQSTSSTPLVFPVSEQRTAGKSGMYHEASTIRPSEPPRKQLSKVVKQLQDEFVHLKMAYQEKVQEFLSLDPSRGKRRRKAITLEINDLVQQMDYKCDQIYALYDVVEEVTAKRKYRNAGGSLSKEFLKQHGNAEVAIYSEDDEMDHQGDAPGGKRFENRHNDDDTSMMLPNGLESMDDDETNTTEIGLRQVRGQRIRHDHQNVADTSAEMEVADTYEESLLL